MLDTSAIGKQAVSVGSCTCGSSQAVLVRPRIGLIVRRQIDRVIASQSEKGSLPEGYSGTGGWRLQG